MLILTFKKFNESSMFSFFRKKSYTPPHNELIGKVVAIDTTKLSSDGYILTHIYVVKDNEGKIGKFVGNIKRNSKGKFIHFKKFNSNLVEDIEGWRDLSEIELKQYNIGSKL
jgi:hypothetical protein